MPFPHPHTPTHTKLSRCSTYSKYRLQVGHACQHCKRHGDSIGGHENNPPPQMRGHLHHTEPGLLVSSDHAPCRQRGIFNTNSSFMSPVSENHSVISFPRLSHAGNTGSSHDFPYKLEVQVPATIFHNPEIPVPEIVAFPMDGRKVSAIAGTAIDCGMCTGEGREKWRPHRHAASTTDATN